MRNHHQRGASMVVAYTIQEDWSIQSMTAACQATPFLPSLSSHPLQTGIACLQNCSDWTLTAHVNKTPTSCFRFNVFQLKKLNKRNSNDMGLVLNMISKQKSC